ncbi:MAG: glycosyltransferase [Patescibacteria group bacterium]
MTVCYFGFYDPHYNRNRVFLEGLAHHGISVVECVSRHRGIGKFFDLIRQHRVAKGKYDALIVGFPGYQAVIVARLLTRKPIIFDAFSPLYDSMVHDRKLARPMSVRAIYYWMLDWVSMHCADVVLFDTTQHVEYAAAAFSIPKEKLKRVFVGAPPELYPPAPAAHNTGKYTVAFFGTFIPLHGIEYIVEAARLLEKEDVAFLIIGNGQEKENILRLTRTLHLNNISFSDTVPEHTLAQEVASADVCLGIFGDTHKTQRVIPNKVYAYAAMRKPIITADTPAIRELFDERDMVLVPAADSQALADAIMRLRDDRALADRLAAHCRHTFLQNATPEILGAELAHMAQEITTKH